MAGSVTLCQEIMYEIHCSIHGVVWNPSPMSLRVLINLEATFSMFVNLTNSKAP